MTRNLLSEGCSKRFKSEDEWFPREISLHSRAWFARVPTEANIADFPSRLSQHPLLVPEADVSDSARLCFQSLVSTVESNSGLHVVDGGDEERATPSSKKRGAS